MAKAKDKPRVCVTCPWRNAYPVYDGKRYACHLTGHNVYPEQQCILKVSDALFEALTIEDELATNKEYRDENRS